MQLLPHKIGCFQVSYREVYVRTDAERNMSWHMISTSWDHQLSRAVQQQVQSSTSHCWSSTNNPSAHSDSTIAGVDVSSQA